MLYIVSKKIKRSWWVLYKIGYGKRAENSVSTFLFKGIDDIPLYLSMSNLLNALRALTYRYTGCYYQTL